MATARLKSKMKKEDPNNFSIHDFLNEGKSSDSSDARFEDAPQTARENNMKSFVVGNTLKLGNLYSLVAARLARENGWRQKKDDSGRFNLILGGKQGQGIPFKRFSQLFKWDYGVTPHCNYFRNHMWLTQKVKLVQSLRQSREQGLTPETFVYFPSTAEDSELDELRAASEGGAKRAVSNNTWIARATDAARGEKTLITDDFGALADLLTEQDKTGAAWSIQRYVSNPLLLPGGKKFDLRFFVLLDHQFNYYLCEKAVVKTCQQPFSMQHLDDKLAHLSFGSSHEEGFHIEQLQKWLSSEHNAHYDATVLEPVQHAVHTAMQAVKTNMINADHADFTSFQVFAFDFIVDDNLKVWLLEASAPTTFPQEMAQDLADDIVDMAIKPVFSEFNIKGPSPPGRLFVPCTGLVPSKQNNKK